MSRSLRPARNLGALALSSALLLAAAAPGTAATPLADGSAVGLSLTLGGQTNDSGSLRVTDDGSGPRTSGSRDPAITVLGNQSLVSAGTLAQNVATSVVDDAGVVRACAGLAGDGATLAAVGEGDCLTPGDQLRLNAANFDLSEVTVTEGEALEPLSDGLETVVAPVRANVLDAIDDAVADALVEVGDPGVFLDLGAVQSSCLANARGASGDASLAGASLVVDLPDGPVNLASLPVDPPPDTHVLTDLSVVVDTFNAALQEQLSTGLQGALASLGEPADRLFTEINANVVTALEPQLAPLEEDLLDITLNQQVRLGARAIEVTALDLQALDAAEEASGTDLLSAQIGRTACTSRTRGPGGPGDDNPDGPGGPVSGPGGSVSGPGGPGSGAPGGSGASAPGGPGTTVPTSVPAGLAGRSDDDDGLPVGLAILLALAGGAGVGAYRRRVTA